MLKIRINNEEVVSNKDFTINEEMLNTSSVILNNVYPKTWEDDKDYVSRFYHPNDYSKCLISDETDVPEEPGTIVEDTSFSINVDTTKEYEFTSYKGQTTQSGTPTPTAPQPINVVSGRQDVMVIGKNLFDASIIGNYTSQGINVSQQGQEVILSGTPTRAWGSTPKRQLPQTLRAGETYYFSSNSRVPIRLWFYASTTTTTIVSNVAYNTSFTPSEDINAFAFVFEGLTVGQTYNETLTIQVEKGSATEYEAYKENTYKINLGKNLLNLNNITATTINGITFTPIFQDNKLQYININGTATSNAVYQPTTFKTTYNNVLNGCFGGSSSTYKLDFWVNGTLYPNYNNENTQLPNNSNGTLRIVVYSGKTVNNVKIYPMISVGGGEYSPYKTPIELCKIGNYQDRIFKSSGKNLFDKDNEQWTSGYITGSSATTLSPSTYNRTLYISCQPNTTYTIQKMVSVSSSRFFIASSIDIPSANVNIYNVYNPGDTATSATYTTSSNAKYLLVNYMQTNTTTTTVEQMLNSIMINEGSTVLPYEPYGTGWFIEKNIGKYTFTGASGETWLHYSVAQGHLFRCNNIVTDDKNVNTIVPYSNYYQGIPYSQQSSRANGQFYLGMDTTIDFLNNDITTVADWRTWLSTHNTSVYYVLATPTYTEITDSELIYQLEGIRLIEGLNNIGISTPYLPMIMNLHYNFVIPRTDVDILFCGVVKNSGNISLNPRDPHYQTLQILSYKTFLSEGETLDFVIYQKTIKEAIEQVVGVIADYGFVVGNINLTNGDEAIGAYSTKDKTAYDVFNYLADITQSRWTTRLIDENTVAIDFYDPTLLPLGTAIDYTNECFENHTIDNMSYSYGSNDYRNKQVMTSQEVYSNISQTQSVIANGYQTQFNVEQKIGKINYIKIGATFYTIATNQEKEMGVSADFYYTPGNNYFESATTIAVGTSITVEYIPIVEGRQIISNSTEIDRIANSTGVKGVIARYENRNDAITSQELQKIGQSYIKYKGVPEIILTVQTRSNLWNIGDRVPFNAPIDELKTEYMVKAKKINYITTIDTIFYTYELTSSFNSENAINYFDNQRAKATGNIGSGEYISRNIDIQSDANIIFYDTTATEIEIVGDNTLEAVLEAPFVS